VVQLIRDPRLLYLDGDAAAERGEDTER
jgi:hypothetical protein